MGRERAHFVKKSSSRYRKGSWQRMQSSLAAVALLPWREKDWDLERNPAQQFSPTVTRPLLAVLCEDDGVGGPE